MCQPSLINPMQQFSEHHEACRDLRSDLKSQPLKIHRFIHPAKMIGSIFPTAVMAVKMSYNW
jgi:hypothetical protein